MIMQLCSFFLCFLLLIPSLNAATLWVGVGKVDITPPRGTPSAGYLERQGRGMEGVRDPLLATALYIDNEDKKIVFCSVDNMGFTHSMVQEVTRRARQASGLNDLMIYVGSSHTHSGGGAFLDFPVVGEGLAGSFNPEITESYIEGTVQAIVQATQEPRPSKVGVAYDKLGGLSYYRAKWPEAVIPPSSLTVLKFTTEEDKPLALLFNYALHPTALRGANRLFSADFVGEVRTQLAQLLDSDIHTLYFNGAQAELIPARSPEESDETVLSSLGQKLAEKLFDVWQKTKTKETLSIETTKLSYILDIQVTPQGLKLPIDDYPTEMNAIYLDGIHAFITIPGELSCVYDSYFQKLGESLGYAHVSILGLTNDAHGYIILPEAWRRKTGQASLSFGGENYGELTRSRVELLLRANTIPIETH